MNEPRKPSGGQAPKGPKAPTDKRQWKLQQEQLRRLSKQQAKLRKPSRPGI